MNGDYLYHEFDAEIAKLKQENERLLEVNFKLAQELEFLRQKINQFVLSLYENRKDKTGE